MALSKTIICGLSVGFLLAGCSSPVPDNPMKDAQAACSGVAPPTDSPPQAPYSLCLQTYLSARSNVPGYMLTYVNSTVQIGRQYDAGQMSQLEYQSRMRGAVQAAADTAKGK